MACVKEYIHNNAHIRIMDDDVVSPEEQALILKQLQSIAWEVKRTAARQRGEEPAQAERPAEKRERKAKYLYTALIAPMEDGSGYSVTVPDLPGCVTSGKDLEDAIEQVSNAMGGYLCVQEDEGLPIPEATKPEDIPHGPNEICYLVSVDMPRFQMMNDNRPVRKSVSLPAWMAKMADERHINCSQLLQQALRARLKMD